MKKDKQWKKTWSRQLFHSPLELFGNTCSFLTENFGQNERKVFHFSMTVCLN